MKISFIYLVCILIITVKYTIFSDFMIFTIHKLLLPINLSWIFHTIILDLFNLMMSFSIPFMWSVINIWEKLDSFFRPSLDSREGKGPRQGKQLSNLNADSRNEYFYCPTALQLSPNKHLSTPVSQIVTANCYFPSTC